MLSSCLLNSDLLAEAAIVVAEESEYILLKDDALSVTVYEEPDLSASVKVSKSGYVSLPLLGNVKVAGLTLKQAEAQVTALYKQDFLVNPQVNLAIEGYAQRYVIVGGDVNGPGIISYPEEGALDLRAALAQAGGVRETADKSEIYVRSLSGKTQRYSFSSAASKIMQHGDMITVGRSSLSKSTITITGQINSPGAMTLPQAGSLDIITAIANAGGLGRIANKKEVIIRRGNRQVLVSLKDINSGKAPMFYMKAGDIMYIKESRF